MLRLVLVCSVLISLILASSAQTNQTCNSFTFSGNRVFDTCRDLPHQSSYLHWTYEESSRKLTVAFRHGGVSSADKWVAWAINPTGSLNTAMIGAQSLVAVPQSGGGYRAYTSPISSTSTTLQEGNLSFGVSDLSATYQNSEVTIFATLTLSDGATSVIHTWQEGAMSGSTPQSHAMSTEYTSSKETLDLVSGQSQAGGSGNSIRRRRNVHGVLNAVSWGILMPVGAIIARYLKVFKSADPAWFYLHITCQTSAYIIGVAGWGLGLKLGSDSVGVTYSTHRTLGIIMFCLGTLQVFALLLRPSKEHKFRFYWNIYHHCLGYATIIISIINIFKGFDALKASVQDRYNDWKNAYIGIIAALGGIALLLETYTWILVLRRKNSEGKAVSNGFNGVNGTNGYGSRTQQA